MRYQENNETMMTLEREKSKSLYEQATQLFPGGVNSPVRVFSNLEMTPLVVESARGDLLFDADGNQYIDFCLSFGALILGHAHPTVTKALMEQIERGSSYCTLTEYEIKLALKIVRHFPSMEKIRFVSSGTEATMTAIRLARGYTGKKKIVKFNGNYHGHSDQLLVQAGSGVTLLPQATSKGVPQEVIEHTISLPYNDSAALKKLFQEQRDIAAVILEPICGNSGVILSTQEFMETVREETRKQGAVLIMDEIITGFRVGLNGAQALYGIEPDMTCLGKIIGGGFPVAAFGGKKEIMNLLAPLGAVYQAGTLSGNPVAMVAGEAVLSEIEQKGFYEQLQSKADLLTLPIQQMIQQRELPVCLQKAGSMFSLFFGCHQVSCKEDLVALDQRAFKDFFHYLFERGVYIPPSHYEAWFMSSSHTDAHLEQVKEHILDFLNQYY